MLFMSSPKPGLGVNLHTDPPGVEGDSDPLPVSTPRPAHTQETLLGLVTRGQEVTRLLDLLPRDEGTLGHV